MMSPINIVLIIGVVGLLIAVIYFTIFGKRKYTYIIRHVTGSKQLIEKVQGIEHLDETGYSYVLLQKVKEKLPLPPDDAINLDKKGNRFVEVYRKPDGNYCYIKDNGPGEFFEPITTNMKIILANEIVKAKMKDNDWKQFLPMYVGLGFIVMLVLGGMILVGEPLNALSEFTASAANPIIESKRIDAEIAGTLKEIDQGVQLVQAKMNVTRPSDAPN